ESEIRIRISARHAILDAKGVAVADDAEADGAVVGSPGHAGRRPSAGLKALIAVDGGRAKQAQLAGVFHQPTQELALDLRGCMALRIPEEVSSALPQTDVDMARAASVSRAVLGHEGHRLALLFGDFLHALLEEQVHVSHRQRLGV